MFRFEIRLPILAAAGLLACGGVDPEAGTQHQPISVEAQPPGEDYFTPTMVELIATGPAQIFYTMDGREPSGDHAQVYSGPIEVASSTLISFIALGADDTWSVPGSELYTIVAQRERTTELLERQLEVSPTNIFFAARPGEQQVLEKVVTLRSTGPAPVHIESLTLDVNRKGASFYEDGAFQVDGPAAPFDLRPGQRVELKVRYRATASLRSAAIVVVSNEMRTKGHQEVELWGRVINW